MGDFEEGSETARESGRDAQDRPRDLSSSPAQAMAAFSPRFYAGDDAEKNFNTFVAIDFGTTFSGFAFAVGRNSRVFHDEQKVPTCLLLDKDTRLKSFGQDALVEYSDVALDGPTDMYYFDRFKMKLHNEEVQTQSYFRSITHLRLVLFTQYTKITQSYLAQLLTYV